MEHVEIGVDLLPFRTLFLGEGGRFGAGDLVGGIWFWGGLGDGEQQ